MPSCVVSADVTLLQAPSDAEPDVCSQLLQALPVGPDQTVCHAHCTGQLQNFFLKHQQNIRSQAW